MSSLLTKHISWPRTSADHSASSRWYPSTGVIRARILFVPARTPGARWLMYWANWSTKASSCALPPPGRPLFGASPWRCSAVLGDCRP